MAIAGAYDDVKVLVIEDDDGTRRLIRRMLGQIGIESVHECADGLKGLQDVLQHRPTVVLCDIHMSPVDGYQFLKLVREAKVEWVRSLPVLFLTADSHPDSVGYAKEFQIDGYLVKPVSIVTLKSRIDGILARLKAQSG